MKKPRYYQSECADALFRAIERDPNCHPVGAIPTGAGKTMVMCELIDKYMSKHPLDSVLVLSHVKEILEQNHNALIAHFGGFGTALYSAGLGSRDIGKITVAGIQSVYSKPELFDGVGLVIIDECHLVNTKNQGMYRTFLDELENVNYVGLSATPFRTGYGYVHIGEDALFNKLSYDMCDIKGFNELIEKGFLSKLVSKGTTMKLKTDGLKTRMNDYIPKEMSQRFDRAAITERAVDEIIEFGSTYKKWLVFAIDIKHAEHIADTLREKGVPTGCVHSKMEGDRDLEVSKFKAGEYRALVNVDILTTGFDAPDIDLIAMLRPTQSPVLHIQSLGRGMRVAKGKDHCLVLDFAGNVARLGPINDVQIDQVHSGSGNGVARMKECPECQGYLHIAARECEWCGYKYPVVEKISTVAYDGDILRKDSEHLKPQWADVKDMQMYLYEQRTTGTPMLKVQYLCGFNTITEYICYGHPSGTYAKHKADNWVRFRLMPGKAMPFDCNELYRYHKNGWLKTATKILVTKSGKYPTIHDVRFD